MGGAVSTGLDNDELIDNLLDAHYIKTPAVERVFRAVDRAFYFLPEFQENAYQDLAWKSGNIHLSAPCIYSEVVESLRLGPGQSFLNLGSGTGYLSTMVGLILGSYGINHGVEIHEDVVQYAHEKLEEFKRTSAALDRFEFCEPTFIKGNSLCLHTASRQYDRVYCGAACPENHENYMKNLIKVGGVLVMPFNDQLLQITRRSETLWETRSVLPVSFSTLQAPDPLEAKEAIMLPDCEPLGLQEMCRCAIRRLLLSLSESEHPHLCAPYKRPPGAPNKRKRCLRNLVFPILDSSEEDEGGSYSGSGGGGAGVIGEPVVRRSLVFGGGSHRRAGHITAVINIGRAWAGARRRYARQHAAAAPSSDEVESSDVEEERQLESMVVERNAMLEVQEALLEERNALLEERNALLEERNAMLAERHAAAEGEPSCVPAATGRHYGSGGVRQPKREKFDSGLGDEEIENGKGLSSSESEFSNTSDPVTLMMDVDSDSDQNSSGGFVSRKRPVSESADQQPLPTAPSGRTSLPTEVPPIAAGPPPLSYSMLMRNKIQALPLPQPLKAYLNFYRSF